MIWKDVSILLAQSAFGGSWGIAGTTLSSQGLFGETGSRSVTSLVRDRQLQLHEPVARFPEADPACRVVCVDDLWVETT